jgi:rhomboid protease GluP
MSISWGYSPKMEKYIPLGDFPIDKYLIIARQAIENLGWNLSHISETGIIAYTPISFQSYSEEVSIRIVNNFAIVKSECIGIQMWFNDYGKNADNLEKFFHELEYVEFHLKDIWEESIVKFHDFVETQDKEYFEKAPLTAKNKIKNILYLFYPQKGYLVTPILIVANVLYYIFITVFSFLYAIYFERYNVPDIFKDFGKYIGASSKDLVMGGDFWRLITYQFVHWGIFHLFFNMYALVYVGLMVENKLGAKKYLTVYILSGICGGLLSILIHDQGYIGGASGSIFGIFGAFLALLISKTFEKNATKAMLISTTIVCAIMLLNGMRGTVDNTSHIGGLISGFLICFVLINEKIGGIEIKKSWRYASVSVFTLGFAVIIYLLAPVYQSKKFILLENEFQENTLDYSKVYKIPNEMPTLYKLKMVRTNGIEVWQRNLEIVGRMRELKLDKKEAAIRGDYEKITQKTLLFTRLLYAECKDNEVRFKKEMDSVMTEINKAKKIANNRGERYWP